MKQKILNQIYDWGFLILYLILKLLYSDLKIEFEIKISIFSFFQYTISMSKCITLFHVCTQET